MVTETRSLTKEAKKGMTRCTAHVVHSHGMTRCILDYDHNFSDHVKHEGFCSLEDCLHPHIVWDNMFENWLSDNANNDDTVK